MSLVSLDRIMCFECVQIVRTHKINGTEYVRCFGCGQIELADKALDDCFLFIVATSVSDALKKSFARSYSFMPALESNDLSRRERDQMLRTGRVLRAA